MVFVPFRSENWRRLCPFCPFRNCPFILCLLCNKKKISISYVVIPWNLQLAIIHICTIRASLGLGDLGSSRSGPWVIHCVLYEGQMVCLLSSGFWHSFLPLQAILSRQIPWNVSSSSISCRNETFFVLWTLILKLFLDIWCYLYSKLFQIFTPYVEKDLVCLSNLECLT